MSIARMIGLILLCCMVVPACSSSSSNQKPYGSAIATARNEIWQAINSGKCGSATAAIMVDGKIVYAEGFGMANREQGIPVNTATRFNIASDSKMFVTASIMLLVDDGLVSLDRAVTEYLPEFRMADERYKSITVRMLLNHSSGMPGGEVANTCGVRFNDNAVQETFDTLARAHLKHEPGAKAEYCNDGFTVAQRIVERMSGMRYMDFLAARIFKPLGLENTAMSVGTLQGQPVASYYDPKTGKPHPLETISVLGSGGLSSTPMDLCLFADAFSAENRLLKKASLAEMTKAQPSAFQGSLRHLSDTYGLGWDLAGLPRYDAAGIRILAKSGNSANYSSYILTVPDKRISIAVIATGGDAGVMDIAFKILDAVLVEKKLIPQEDKPVFVPPTAQKWPQGEEAFAGYYGGTGYLAQAVFDAEKNSVTIYAFSDRDKAPYISLIYNDGYYYDPQGQRYYFISVGGESYFVRCSSLTGLDSIMLQKIRPLENPQSLRINVDGKVWLRRNVAPYEEDTLAGTHLSRSLLYTDLSGYVSFGGIKKIVSPEFAGMPFDALANQTEMTLIEKDGDTWVWGSDMLYSPAGKAAALQAGENTVTIGNDGYNEWLVAGEDAVLSFARPEQGRIVVFSPDNIATYDSLLDSGGTYVAKGGYVESVGVAGDVFTINANPVNARSASGGK